MSFTDETITSRRGPKATQFKHLAMLNSLEDFTPREDDIWILSYPMSGTIYYMTGIRKLFISLIHNVQDITDFIKGLVFYFHS